MRYIFFYSLLLIVHHDASAQSGTVKDIDGNIYKTVKIGSQVWMDENLKTAHYRDGSPIEELELDTPWSNTGESNMGAWCYYDKDVKNNPTYGKLYNWYAVADTHHLCPTGWHVPSDSEWAVLTDYLGGEVVAGGKMKATTLWNAPNVGADNSSDFTALPAGGRAFDFGGTFDNLGRFGNFWSSVEVNSGIAWSRYLSYNDSNVTRYFTYKGNDLSVRCIRD